MQKILLNKLEEQLHAYCNKLYFEIGGLPGQDQELIITAEGDVEYFAQVEKLISVAPEIQYWRFIAFLPASDDLDYNK